MSDELKAGDIVELLGGSQPMTVEKVTEQGNVVCVWFQRFGDLTWSSSLNRENFERAAIKKAGGA